VSRTRLMRYPYSLHSSDSPETLGVVELTSIANGYAVADAMIKAAPITLLDVTAASPGKFLIIYTGDVASVQEAHAAGVAQGGDSITGTALMYNLSPQVVPAINRTTTSESITEAVGILETFTAPAAVEAADTAAKSTNIVLHSVTLLNGLGGKAFVVMAGKVADVESAISLGLGAIDPEAVADSIVIPAFHPDLVAYLPGQRLGLGGGN
jgi:microcompartment protein CcmL/EutN